MNVIILAAGIPKKMGIVEEPPQCLVEVQGKKIIDYQLEALQDCGITDVYVVVGYEKEKIQAYLGNRVKYIENPDFQNTRSAYSLWLAREECKEGFLYLNADLVFEKEILKRVLDSPHANAFAFDRKYDFSSDMHKIVMLGERIIHHNHRISNDLAHGEAVGPVKISAVFAQEVLKACEEAVSAGNKKKSVYDILSDTAKVLPMHGVNITGLKWCEIDTSEDLVLAEKIFGQRIPFVTLLYGNPATGKTTTSRALQEYCSQFHRTSLISTSSIREELGLVDLYSAEERKAVYDTLMERAATVMRWKNVNLVLDGNFSKFAARKKIYDLAQEHGYQVFLVQCTVAHESVILQRLEKRKPLQKQTEHQKEMEHAAAALELYQMIHQTSDSLDEEKKMQLPLAILSANTEKNTVQLTHNTHTFAGDTLSLLQNGIQYGFAREITGGKV